MKWKTRITALEYNNHQKKIIQLPKQIRKLI